MPIHEVKHPLIRHKLGIMRRADISTKNFRELAQEVGALLTYEATKDFNLQEKTIEGWAGPVNVEQIHGKKVTIVPILRAGLGMLDGVLSLIPVARVSVVGQIRNEETLEASTYLEKLVGELEPVLAAPPKGEPRQTGQTQQENEPTQSPMSGPETHHDFPFPGFHSDGSDKTIGSKQILRNSIHRNRPTWIVKVG